MKYHKVDEEIPLKLGTSCLRSLIPVVGKHNVTVTVFPGDFFISKFYALEVIMFFLCGIFCVMHHW